MMKSTTPPISHHQKVFESAEQLYSHMREFYRRLDSLISDFINENNLTIACAKGCGICCYIKLDVNAHEVLYLTHHIRNVLPETVRTKVIQDLKKSADMIAPLSTRDHFLGRFKCGFLRLERT